MARVIQIEGLKHIRTLRFEMPGRGVHLLAGSNGAGKTTLLACLRRIAYPQAFAVHFPSSSKSERLDNFANARITYELGTASVTYAYGGERWVPRPRANNRLLDRFGFKDVLYVGATADRITPRPEDFEPRRVRPAHEGVRAAANEIFETQRFDDLKTINLSQGVGNAAFLLQTARATYFSEKNFSLGELCVLKMIRSLQRIPVESLLLVDELELALHPRVQINLVRYLERIAAEKRLTVIFSTHSVSLIKSVPRNRLLYLENTDGAVSTIPGCFPTYALGAIALGEERAPDVVIYVEDVNAVEVVEAFASMFKSERFGHDGRLAPTVKVAPIGPFMSVVRFMGHGRSILPESTRVKAVLDGDVKDETVAGWQASGAHDRLAEFQAHGDALNYLPWAPEQGLVIHFLTAHRVEALRRLQGKFQDNRIQLLPNVTNIDHGLRGSNLRNACKTSFQALMAHIMQLKPGMSEDSVRRGIFQTFCEHYFDANKADVMQLMGPVLA